MANNTERGNTCLELGFSLNSLWLLRVPHFSHAWGREEVLKHMSLLGLLFQMIFQIRKILERVNIMCVF